MGRISDDYYAAEKVTDRIDAIRSKTGEIMYLIKGDKEAYLIDTCLGVGDLRCVVESLTALPVSVILTHGHVDHAMGAPLFDTVYFNHADDEVYTSHSPLAQRQGYIEATLGAEPGSWQDADYVPVTSSERYKPLDDGMIFDLGGIHLEVYALPGHTPGSMVILVPEEHILITGDAANNSTFVFDRFSLSIEEYREALQQVADRLQGRYDRCFMMHHDMEASGNLLSNVIEVCDRILRAQADDQPFSFMGGQYFIAKKVGERFKRKDGKEGNVVYSKDKIFAAET